MLSHLFSQICIYFFFIFAYLIIAYNVSTGNTFFNKALRSEKFSFKPLQRLLKAMVIETPVWVTVYQHIALKMIGIIFDFNIR